MKLLQRITSSLFYPVLSQVMFHQLERQTEKLKRSMISHASPLDWFVEESFSSQIHGHFGKTYPEWRMRRISKILELHDLEWFKDKRILELGGGLGIIGAFFASLGAKVVSGEYRTGNRNFANIMHRNIPTFKSIYLDAEKDFSHFGKFDLILCLGFIEVMPNYKDVLECCARMSNEIILENMVCDSQDPNAVMGYDFDPEVNDTPSHGTKGTCPSPALFEKFFTEAGFKIERYFTADLTTRGHCYDWVHENNNRVVRQDGAVLRRFWRFHKA